MPRRYWVVGWDTPGWTEPVARSLSQGYLRHGVETLEVIEMRHFNKEEWSSAEVVRGKESALVLVPPSTHQLIDTAECLTRVEGWAWADLAIVDCRVQDIRDIIDVISGFPKWPIAWWPKMDQFRAHTKSFIDQLVSRQVQLMVGAGVN